jgi:hypothetical protein
MWIAPKANGVGLLIRPKSAGSYQAQHHLIRVNFITSRKEP